MADRVPNNRKPVIRPFKPSYAGARGMSRRELFDHIQAFQKVQPSTEASTQTAAPTATSAPASPGTGGGSVAGSSVTLSNLPPATLSVGGTADPGISTQVSRSDHAHAMPGVFGAAGTNHASGFAPDPGAVSHATGPYYLGDDGNYHQLVQGANITLTWASGGVGGLTIAASSSGSTPIDYISGCVLSWVSATQVQIGTGTVGLASGSSYTVSSAITLTPTMSASTLYYVYLTSATTATVNSTAPSTNYQGTAWNDGTTSHRYVGAFLTDASSHIVNFIRSDNQVLYSTNILTSPYQVLSTTSPATTSTSISCASVMPATSRMVLVRLETGAASNAAGVGFGSSDSVTPTATTGSYVVNQNTGTTNYQFAAVPLRTNSSQAFLYCSNASMSQIVINVMGYLEDR